MALFDRLFRNDDIDNDFDYDEPEQETYEAVEDTKRPLTRRTTSNRVVDFRAGERRSTQHEVILLSPNDFNMTWQICDHVRDGKTVICNIEGVQSDMRQRFVDFINGASYALGGVLQSISTYIFLFAPKTTTISVPDVVQAMDASAPPATAPAAFEREPEAGLRRPEGVREPRAFRTHYL